MDIVAVRDGERESTCILRDVEEGLGRASMARGCGESIMCSWDGK